MVTLLDAAYAPPKFVSGQPWAGYLSSPTAYHAWSPAQLAAALPAGLLPVYVAPLTLAGFRARNGAADARAAVAQVHKLGPVDRLVVALDLEARAFEAAPNLSIGYAVAFTQAVHAAGGITVHYGSRAFLGALHPYLVHHAPGAPAHAWLAWYTTATAWPLAAWPSPRAWQYRNNVHAQGTTVDVSRVDATFPLCHRPRPAPRPPAPAPAPKPPAPTHTAADAVLAAAFTSWRTTKGL